MTAHTHTSDDRRKKRAAVARFVLAGVAVLGIGAAATSAAWTDDAWFSADASAATFEIQGKNFAATPAWVDADAGFAIQVPADELANLIPGQTRTFDIQIRNNGSVPAMLVTTATFGSTAPANDFMTDPTVTHNAPATLAAGAEATVTVTVKTDPNWAAGNQGKSEVLTIQFQGTATAS